MNSLFLTKLATIILATSLGTGHALSQGCEDPAVLRFASVPKSDVAQQSKTYRPLLKELERVLERRVELVRSNSYSAVIEGLHTAHVDLAELGPASYALVMERGAAVTAFAALSYSGTPGPAVMGTYRAVLVARADSGYQSIKDLRGKTLSLTDPVSTSGALLPIQAIRKLTGEPMEQYFSRVTYAGSHLRAIDAVQKKLVSAAFVSSKRVEEYQEQKGRAANAMTVLWQSPPIPTDPFVYRNNLCPAVVEKIRKVFLEASPALEPMFEEMGGRRYVPAADADYQSIRELVRHQ